MFFARLLVAISGVIALQRYQVSAQSAEEVIVWVHGLFNFGGADKAFPYKKEYYNRGFTNLVVDIGPISSNWDRACEVYAQIKGTVVDYGVCHSREHGHARFGEDFTGRGLFPQWDENNRIHFIGHSMGGQTIRQLEIFLQEGSGCAEDTSELFTGNERNWIRSITTMATPHDGTSLVEQLGDRIMSELKNIIIGFSGAEDDSFFDDFKFKLDHWGVIREPGESFDSYFDRLVDEGVIRMNNKDLAHYSLSKAGSKEMNKLGKMAYANTHYFAFANERTKVERKCRFWIFNCDNYEVAEELMAQSLHLPAEIIGGSHLISGNTEEFQRKNDGAVNWENMKCPSTATGGSKSNCKEYSGSWSPSTWYWMDIPYFDHVQITALDTINDNTNYQNSAKRLNVEHAERLADTISGFSGASIVSARNGFVGATLVDLGLEEDQKGLSPATQGSIFFLLLGGFAGLAIVTVHKIRNRNSFITSEKATVTHFDL